MPISVDRFVEDRRARWARLAALVQEAQGRVTRLGADETLELGHLYRAATSDLAIAQRDELVRRVPGSEIPIDARPVAGPLIIANNIYVSVVAFGGGLTLGLLTIYALVENGAMLGTIFAVLIARGVAGNLLTFILSHGFLELSAIFFSGGAGLRFAWAILHPGDLYRRDAIRLAGVQAIQVMFLVAASLTVAGILEAFVSPTLLPVGVKLAIGVTTGALLWGYVLFAGTGRLARQRKRFFSSR